MNTDSRTVSTASAEEGRPFRLKALRLGIESHEESQVFLHEACPVCRSEGFSSHARVVVTHGARSTIATLYQVYSDLVDCGQAGFSDAAWRRLDLQDGAEVTVSHAPPVESLSAVRGKVYGRTLDRPALGAIVADIAAGRYSNIQLSAFLTACAARPLDDEEMTALTGAMVDVGERISWDTSIVADKHSIGGLPGNRTTPIVVAIVAACGLVIPKTSSRAITSPAGTADTMETLAPVNLDVASMRRVVEREGGCVVWGGAVKLSPIDDVLIRVERVLDLDGEGQMVASILSKKIAAGATHLVLDLPVGPTAKLRSAAAAKALSDSLVRIGHAFGLQTQTLMTDGTQPVGRGIGPALEARDVLAVLRTEAGAPPDLRERALMLAGKIVELTGMAAEGEGRKVAGAVLDGGKAWEKFQRICEAQGGMRTPGVAAHQHVVVAADEGRLRSIDSRRLAKIAKLAGAPDDKTAGLELHVRLGERLEAGQPLFTIHAETPGELAYALDYARANSDLMGIVER